VGNWRPDQSSWTWVGLMLLLLFLLLIVTSTTPGLRARAKHETGMISRLVLFVFSRTFACFTLLVCFAPLLFVCLSMETLAQESLLC
jgi:hypothetical protein